MILRLPQKNLSQAQVLLENKRRFLWMKRNMKEVSENNLTLEKLLKTLKTLLKTLETLKKNLLQTSLKRNQNKKNLKHLQQKSICLLQSKRKLHLQKS